MLIQLETLEDGTRRFRHEETAAEIRLINNQAGKWTLGGQPASDWYVTEDDVVVLGGKTVALSFPAAHAAMRQKYGMIEVRMGPSQ